MQKDEGVSDPSIKYRLKRYPSKLAAQYDEPMPRLTRTAVLLATLTAAATGHAQPHPSPLKPLAFLTGRWTSETPTEIQEENWSPVIGNSMTGSFRVVAGGKPVFYEYWAVEMDPDATSANSKPVLKLKHYNAGLAGWEEKNDSTRMPLISSSADDAAFAEADGSVSLHYHRTANTLTCTVHHVKNGKASDEIFTLTRAPSK
jgi:hypothetical protein